VATDDAAWARAMLRFEAALATGAGRAGLVDGDAAATVADVCTTASDDVAAHLDLAALALGAATQATPVVELLRQVHALVPEAAHGAVHVAATSQDVLDTGLVLVARDATAGALRTAHAVESLLRDLAGTHRDTPMVGRTLLQHGEPTTFGAVAAVRAVGVREAAQRLAEVRVTRLAVQLGGAVGTLAPAGGRAEAFVAAVAEELGLPVPDVPWHPTRGRVAELAAALGGLAGELAGVARDVVLLASTDVGEVSVAAPGGSSAMPHKENPARAVLALACAHRVPALVASVLAGMPGDLQRAAGAWQAEAPVVVDLLRLTAATAEHVRATLDGLVVHTDRMRENIDALLARTGGSLDTAPAAAVVDRALRPQEEEPT
jgi:3-carboxy-cis,cis-muconate cycloisomerase